MIPIVSIKRRYILIAMIISLATVSAFAWVYAAAPFSEFLNAIVVNGLTVLSALFGALILTRITLFFHAGEPPRVIWVMFAISIWLWTLADGIWAYYYVTVGEVPVFTLADVLWFVGYMTLSLSLVRQFRLVSFRQTNRFRRIAIGMWIAVLFITATILLVTKSQSPMQDFFRYFYPLADSAVGLCALYLARAFRGRALAIPWLTIMSFVVTDVFYTWTTASGVYDLEMSGVSFALVADTLYVASYLIVAWGAFGHYLLLRFGADPSEPSA